MVTVRLPLDMEEKLSKIAEATRRPKSFYVKEALERYLDEIEEFYIALDMLSRPGSKYYTTEEVKKELDL